MKRMLWVALFFVFLFCGCTENHGERQVFIMDTVVNMSVYADEPESILNEIEVMLSEVDEMCSPTDPKSQINMVNNSENRKVALSKKLENLLLSSKKISLETSGAFDITLGSLIINLPSKTLPLLYLDIALSNCI